MKLLPIETAPKDGTHILLYGQLESDTGVVNDFKTDTTPIKGLFQGYYDKYQGWYHIARYPAYPTHWTVLPEE